MDGIRSWALLVCTAAAAFAVIENIASQSKNSRFLRLVMSAVMLSILITPLTKIRDIQLELDGYELPVFEAKAEFSELVEKQTADLVGCAVKEMILSRVESCGITPSDISVETDISDDGCISIGQVTVTIYEKDSSRSALISDMLFSSLGINAEVRIQEEVNEY